jgi:molybdate transport system substrate-binding protein
MRVAVLLLMLLAAPLSAGEPLRIAVAANFKPTLETITQQFQDQSGIKVTLSSASTGVLATQILYGAPFDLFFAADRETPQRVLALKTGKSGDAFCYALGSLVLTGGDGGLSALAQPGFSLAIANPATAPYGRAAMEVLTRPEFEAGDTRKLVRGNNAIQVYQFWHSGAVDLALLPRALAPANAARIPLAWHEPLEQYAVVLRHTPSVNAYLNWIRSDTVRALIMEAGYEPCP